MPPAHDIYLSHYRYDARSARALAQALAARGISARFRDGASSGPGDETGARPDTSLLASKAVVCLYSADYGRYRECQQELVAAVTAARAAGDVAGRVLVVVTEKDDAHVVPRELRARAIALAPEPIDSATIAALAARIAERVAGLAGSLGSPHGPQRPSWIGPRDGADFFVGRAPELWEIHERLLGGVCAHSLREAPAAVQLVGPVGTGKSTLAAEYALRFGAAHGGVVWLSAKAAGAGDAGDVLGNAVRVFQRGAVARALGIETNGLGEQALEGALAAAVASKGPRVLWIVDGLPPGLDAEAARGWLPPCPAATLVTTRNAEHGELGEPYEVGPLADVDAYELLTGGEDPTVESEELAAWTIVEDLGGHPLALEVAGAAAPVLRPDAPLAAFRARIANPRRDLLDFATGLGTEVPSSNAAAIAGTLWHAFQALGDEALDCLRLAALLAPAHVPEDLGVCALGHLDGIGRDSAWERFLAGVAELASTALVEPAGCTTPGFAVHPLVTRVFAFYDRASAAGRQQVMQRSLASALDETAPPSAERGAASRATTSPST